MYATRNIEYNSVPKYKNRLYEILIHEKSLYLETEWHISSKWYSNDIHIG